MKSLFAIMVLTLALLTGCESSAIPGPDRESRQESRQIVAFQATWCAPCQRDKPTLAQIEQSVPVTRYDADQSPDLVRQYGVNAFPTYICYQGNAEVLRTSDIRELNRFITSGDR